MARGVGTLAGQLSLLVGEHLVLEALKGALAVIVGLGGYAHGVGGGEAGDHQFPDFGCVIGAHVQAKGHVKFGQQGLVGPHGVALGDLGALGVQTLLLAPRETHHVVGKLRAVECGRCRQTLDEVRQLIHSEIGLHFVLCIHRHGGHDGGQNNYKTLLHEK